MFGRQLEGKILQEWNKENKQRCPSYCFPDANSSSWMKEIKIFHPIMRPGTNSSSTNHVQTESYFPCSQFGHRPHWGIFPAWTWVVPSKSLHIYWDHKRWLRIVSPRLERRRCLSFVQIFFTLLLSSIFWIPWERGDHWWRCLGEVTLKSRALVRLCEEFPV